MTSKKLKQALVFATAFIAASAWSAGNNSRILNATAIQNGAGSLGIPPAPLPISRALVNDTSNNVAASSVLSSELAFVSGVTSSLCGINQSCTQTNKTFTAPILNNAVINTSSLASVTADNLALTGTAGSGYLDLPNQSSDPAAPASGHMRDYSDSSGRMAWKNALGFSLRHDLSAIGADRIITWPASALTVVGNANTATLTNKTLTTPNLDLPVVRDTNVSTKQIAYTLSGAATSTTLTLADNQSTSQTLNFPNISATDSLATLGVANAFSGANTHTGAETFKGQANLSVLDSTDPTKKMQLDPSGNTTNITGTLKTIFTTAKTVTFPDTTTVLGGLGTAQSWTSTNNFLDGTNLSIFIRNGADISKRLLFALGGSTTGVDTTLATQSSSARTINLPDASGSLALRTTDDIWYTGWSALGSTAGNTVVRWTTNQGTTGLSRTADSANGDTFIIPTNGIYTTTLCLQTSSASLYIGITRNPSAGNKTTGISSISEPVRLKMTRTPSSTNTPTCVSDTSPFTAGDAIAAQVDSSGAVAGGGMGDSIRITRIQ